MRHVGDRRDSVKVIKEGSHYQEIPVGVEQCPADDCECEYDQRRQNSGGTVLEVSIIGERPCEIMSPPVIIVVHSMALKKKYSSQRRGWWVILDKL